MRLRTFLHLLARELWQWYFKCLQKFQCQNALLCHETTPLYDQSRTANVLNMKMDTLCLVWSDTVPLFER